MNMRMSILVYLPLSTRCGETKPDDDMWHTSGLLLWMMGSCTMLWHIGIVSALQGSCMGLVLPTISPLMARDASQRYAGEWQSAMVLLESQSALGLLVRWLGAQCSEAPSLATPGSALAGRLEIGNSRWASLNGRRRWASWSDGCERRAAWCHHSQRRDQRLREGWWVATRNVGSRRHKRCFQIADMQSEMLLRI